MGAGLVGILGLVIGIVSLVCAVMTLIKIFQDKANNGVLHGVIGIVTCGLWAFIWGWINNARFGNKKIMLIWTACIVANLVLQFAFGVSVAGSGGLQPM